MSAPEPSLLPGQSPPFFTVTPTDQAGVIVNVAAICLVLVLASILIRAYVRFEINRQAWSWDDGVIVAALVGNTIRGLFLARFANAGYQAFHLVQTSFIFHQISLGLGKAIGRLDSKQIADLQRV
jgi:predicted permease